MVEYLIENYGTRSVKAIAAYLNLTKTQVVKKAISLKLGGAYDTGMLNKRQVCSILKMKNETITKLDIPFQKRRMISQMMYFIKLEDLLDWLEDNQDKFYANNIQRFALGVEPNWLKEKRETETRERQRWTPTEMANLKEMYRNGIPYEQIAIELKRSKKAVSKKMNRLKDFNQEDRRNDWTYNEIQLLKKYVSEKITDKEIAIKLNKTESSITNKRFVLGLTKKRALIMREIDSNSR